MMGFMFDVVLTAIDEAVEIPNMEFDVVLLEGNVETDIVITSENA